MDSLTRMLPHYVNVVNSFVKDNAEYLFIL